METKQTWKERKISRVYIFCINFNEEFQVAYTKNGSDEELKFLDKKSCDNINYSFEKIKAIFVANGIDIEDWEIENSNTNCSNCSNCFNCSNCSGFSHCSYCSDCSDCFNCSNCSCLSNKENYKNNKEGGNK